MRSTSLLLLAFLATGCFRTHYENFSPANPIRTSQPPQRAHGTGWQHFFLYGLVPGKRVIDARALCGSAENVDSIATKLTFVEGLVAALAGYYINIYSPIDGAVYCKQDPKSLPQTPSATQPSTTP